MSSCYDAQGRRLTLATRTIWRTPCLKASASSCTRKTCTTRRITAIYTHHWARGAASWAPWSTAYARCSSLVLYITFSCTVKHERVEESRGRSGGGCLHRVCAQTVSLGVGPIIQFDAERANVIKYSKPVMTVRVISTLYMYSISTVAAFIARACFRETSDTRVRLKVCAFCSVVQERLSLLMRTPYLSRKLATDMSQVNLLDDVHHIFTNFFKVAALSSGFCFAAIGVIIALHLELICYYYYYYYCYYACFSTMLLPIFWNQFSWKQGRSQRGRGTMPYFEPILPPCQFWQLAKV